MSSSIAKKTRKSFTLEVTQTLLRRLVRLYLPCKLKEPPELVTAMDKMESLVEMWYNDAPFVYIPQDAVRQHCKKSENATKAGPLSRRIGGQSFNLIV
ncbi:hypothetical protein E2C01_067300 [Portunus trituberculatus]|uniref:Uncharacterized protein n=1 Tax=Portunus trituberculatus TaxID=210409 RepID=A0A5B7HX32_PORTR|nr:hypothetical protein [Portunus trituberculatus]